MIRAFFVFALLGLIAPAHAFTAPQNGPYADLGGGISFHGKPVKPHGSAILATGVWWGPYDNVYAIGKFNSLGLTVRSEFGARNVGLTPMLEYRRGWDLLVTAVHLFVAGGATIHTASGDVGGAARVGVGAKWRKHRFWGLGARLEGGVDIMGGKPLPTGALLLHGSYARPKAKFLAEGD